MVVRTLLYTAAHITHTALDMPSRKHAIRTHNHTPQTPPSNYLSILHTHTNRTRHTHKRGPLRLSNTLTSIARAHGKDMCAHTRLRHRGSDGSRLSKRCERGGYDYRRVCENVARGQRNVGAVMKAWMGSKGHRKCVLGDGGEMGAWCGTGRDGRLVWCLVVGRRKG